MTSGVRTLCVWILVAALLVIALPQALRAQQPETVTFMTTTAVPELYDASFKRLMAQYPNIRINWRPTPAGRIREVALSTMMANPDDLDVFAVMYGDLGAFAAANLATSLDDLSWAPEVKSSLAASSLANASFGGKFYGIPYFSAVHIFIYNKRFLKAAGTDVPPRTWDELVRLSRVLEEKGLFAKPMLWPMNVAVSSDSLHWSWQIVAASWCQPLWDKNLKPLFLTPSSPGWRALQFFVDAIYKSEIMDLSSLEMEPGQIMQLLGKGQVPFGFQTSPHELIRINSPGSSPEVGNFTVTPAPEQGCSTLRSDIFAATARARARGGRHWDAVQTVIRWLGDANNFAKPFGLTGRGWGFKSLNTDVELRQSWGAWMDMAQWSRINQKLISYTQLNPHYSQPYFPELRDYMNAEIQKALLRKQTVEATLKAIAAKADELSRHR